MNSDEMVSVPRSVLEKIVDYMHDEEDHYRNFPSEDHIYLAVKAIAAQLDSQD